MVNNFYERNWRLYSTEEILALNAKENSEIIEVENEVETEISEEIEETEKTETSENEVEVIPIKTKKTSKK